MRFYFWCDWRNWGVGANAALYNGAVYLSIQVGPCELELAIGEAS